MKILHTADWHLGKRLESFSRHEEQKDVMQEMCDIAERERVDAVVISGDLFDTYNPPTEAVDLFYKTLKKLANNGKRAVIAIAGNHDSPDRIEAPDPLARECGIIFAGYPNSVVQPFVLDSGLKVMKSEEGFIEIQLPESSEPLRIILTPYANEFRLKTFLGRENSEEELRKLLEQKWAELAKKYCDTQGVNLLAAHLFMMKKGGIAPIEPEDEKPILHVGGAQAIYSENIPEQIQYVALGHLHRHHVVDQRPCPVVYSGSPLSYSFGEANQDKFVIVVEAAGGEEVAIRRITLDKGKRLLRKKAEGIEDAVAWLSAHQDTWVELTMVTESFLTAEDRKLLSNVHEGIISIIPEVKNKDALLNSCNANVDLSKGMEELFIDYFKNVKGQEPNSTILDLFKEVLSEEEEE